MDLAFAKAPEPCIARVPVVVSERVAAGPDPACPKDPSATPPVLATGTLRIAELPAVALSVELARTPREQERGLMYRRSMPSDHGMWFMLGGSKLKTFWMHDTCIPLDMVFAAADGTVVGILENVPAMTDQIRQAACPSSFVLEVNAGWVKAHGLVPGDHVTVAP